MRGLLRYELSCMKKTIYLYLAFLIIYCLLGVFGRFSDTAGTFVIFFSIFFIIGMLVQWEQYKWDVLTAALPVSRRQIIGSIYILCLIATACGVVLAFLSLAGATLLHGNKTAEYLQEGSIGLAACIAAALIYLAVSVPVIVRFGAAKGRMICIAIFLIPCLILAAFSKSQDFMAAADILERYWHQILLALPVICAAAIILSVIFSMKLYEKKDL